MLKNGTILILEDDDTDFFFLKRALASAGSSHALHQVRTGEEAIEYLSGANRFAEREEFPFPVMLITDCKTSGLSGLEVMRWMRANPQFHVVPTVFLTGNTMPMDVRVAYDLGAQAVLVKPRAAEELKCCIASLYDFWSRCAEIPARHEGS